MKDFSNKVVIITGCASGMGYAITKNLLEKGAKVIGFSLEDSTDIKHSNFIYVRGSITNERDCQEAIKVGMDNFKKINSLINCAGATISGDLEDLNEDDFKMNFEVNVFGTFNMCKAAIGELKKHKSSIVNISSDMSIKPMYKKVGYNPSKAALNMLSDCIALDYAPNVRVNTIMPGVVETPLFYERLNKRENPEARRKEIESWYILNRIGNVDDITNVAEFLISEDSDWMTGAKIPVCGGSQIS